MNEGRDGFWAPSISVEAGAFGIAVGGDSSRQVLNASVAVKAAHPLTTEYMC